MNRYVEDDIRDLEFQMFGRVTRSDLEFYEDPLEMLRDTRDHGYECNCSACRTLRDMEVGQP